MYHIKKGKPFPLGATADKAGVNFAVYSPNATAVSLVIFIAPNIKKVISLTEKSEHIWHIYVEGAKAGLTYGYYVDGEQFPFNSNKLLLDPYAKLVLGKPDYSTEEKYAYFLPENLRDNTELAPKAIVVDNHFDWQNDKHPRTAWSDTVIYELSVKGFSQLNPRIPAALRGTYAGLAHPESVAYLKKLGISAVELLPIAYHVDEPHLQRKGLTNYWGYNVLSPFAIETDYANGSPQEALNEFKTLVRTLHQAGIEVILDVVFNHTAELGIDGPMLSFRGFDDNYYLKNEEGYYHNWSGCGNMLKLSSEVGQQYLLDCLKYWVEECHVDGFRFDLATALGREPQYSTQAVLFDRIFADPTLSQVKLIAEPWDIGENGYQLGRFPAYFAEWNDRYRDDMRKFIIWQSGELGAFAERFSGSSDIFHHIGNQIFKTVNFITAHDGFCLQDLVSYNRKYNHANAEDNRDGHNDNHSYNYGIEGVENVPQHITALRQRVKATLLGSLLLSHGVPMLLAGDEFGHSQQGNNNSYCQDNETTWLNWQRAEQPQAQIELVRQLIAVRKQIPSLRQHDWWSELNVHWLKANGQSMALEDWTEQKHKALQVFLDQEWLFLINGKVASETFKLPSGIWQIVVDVDQRTNRVENEYHIPSIGFALLHRLKT